MQLFVELTISDLIVEISSYFLKVIVEIVDARWRTEIFQKFYIR